MPRRLARALLGLLVATTAAATRLPLNRRAACSGLLAGATGTLLVPPQHASAEAKGGVQWSIDLPPSFQVQRQLASIVRVRTETVLLADDPATGAQAKLLLLPFGQQAGGSLDSDEQLQLATFFFPLPKDLGEPLQPGADTVSTLLATSASRSPGIVALKRLGAASAVATEDKRYVRYEYASERCAGELDEGQCYGDVSKKRTLATATMSSVSQYRTNTERERMKELGQSRNVEVLWLLTFSAPDAAFDMLRPMFEKASASFFVPAEAA